MPAENESLPDEVSGTAPQQQADPGSVLLQATVQELRDRAERLNRATEELTAQNERLLETQRALEGQRARYRELFHFAPDAWLLTDADGRIIEANQGAADLLEAEAPFLAGKPLAAFMKGPRGRSLRDQLVELEETGSRQKCELRMTHRSGTAIDVEATVAAVPEGDDGGTRLWLLRDVTEQVGAARRLGETLTEREAELEATRAQAERERVHLRDLFQRLQEGVVAVNRDLEVVYANGPARSFFRPTRLVEGKRLPEPWPEVRLGELVATLFLPRPTLRDVRVESDMDVVLSIRGIPALGAGTAGLVITDVSSRERRERAEREFVANAAHELRTPLTAILGSIEVLQRGAKDDIRERDRFLQHIEHECARLERLTAALLVLARAQTGVEAPRLEVVEIEPLLNEVAGEMRPASRVKVEVSCPPGLAALANLPLLERAIGNLAENAAKHTHRGTIVFRGFAHDESLVSLEVSDTGPGMHLQAQERGTERFYRSGNAPGFGLGLAIARESARVLGGRLDVDSQPGVGTTARIVLPSAHVVSSG